MRTDSQPPIVRGERTVRVAAIMVAIFSAAVLLGWAFDFPLIRACGGQVSVKAGTILGVIAVSALVLAVAIWLFFLRVERRVRARIATLEHELHGTISKELQQRMLEGTQFAVIATDPAGIIREFNTGAEQMLGYAKEEIVGKQTPVVFQLTSEVEARATELSVMQGRKIEPGVESFLAQARTGRVDEREWTYVRKDGSRLPVLLRITSLRNKSGEVSGFLSVAQDLTNSKSAEYALKTSEERLHRVLDHAECLVWEAKVSLNGNDWNWQMTIHPSGLYRRLSGLKEGIASVGLWYQFKVPEQEEMNRRSREAMESGSSGYVQEFRLLRGDQVIWIRESVSVSKVETNKFWLVGVAVDITENKLAKTARDELASRLSKLGSMLPGMIYQFRLRPDGSSCVPYSSPGIQQIYGVTPEEVRDDASKLMAVFHPDDAQRVLDAIQQSARACQPWHCEYRVRIANGHERWLMGNSVPEHEVDGSVLWHGFITDITERKASEEALALSNKEIHDLKVAMDEHSIVAITDQKGRITYANDKFCLVSKHPRAELLGRDYKMLYPELQPNTLVESLWEAGSCGQIWKGEVRNLASDGSYYWTDTTIVPFVGSGGKANQYIVISSDITERKQLEASLVQARDQALEASKLKSEFLATMSHEIRTPMNAIIGMANLLVDTPLNDKQAGMTRTIVSGAECLLAIINDILDFSRIEAGRIRIDNVEFDGAKLVQEVMALFAPRANEKRLKFTCEIIPWAEPVLVGDDGRLRQVLLNLVGNAIKFTDAGAVKVTVRPVAETSTRTRLRVEIRDTGVGIPKAAQSRLFQPFVQADGSTTRRFGGTGLGLAISRQLIELMGGEIGFESEDGKGALFWIEVGFQHGKHNKEKPAKITSPDAVMPSGAETKTCKLYGLKLLLVEDNAANREVGVLILEKMGCTVEIATNGQLALEMLAGNDYDVVLMDCQMPIMDGFETTRHIRSGTLPGVSAAVPIIALTAYARAEDRARCLAEGMTDYVAKPLRQHELEAAFERMDITPVFIADAVEPALGDPVLDLRTFETARALKDAHGRSVLPRIVKIYLDEEAKRMDLLEYLAGVRLSEELAQEAHSFGSNAVSFGGMQVRCTALELEHAAKKADWAAVSRHLKALRNACDRLKNELSRYSVT